MKGLFAIAALVAILFAAPASAQVEQVSGACDDCGCVQTPSGETSGCLGLDNDSTLSICGDATTATGCACVAGECACTGDPGC